MPEPPLSDVTDKLHARLVELVVATSVTVPENPSSGVTVIVEGLAAPTFAVTADGVADSVKS